MKKYFLVLFVICITMSTRAQDFPQSFIGYWEGTIIWNLPGKPAQSFIMQLRIRPTDSLGMYSWQIIYGEDEKDNRPYVLKPKNKAMGQWVIDELNGIILDGYVLGSSFQGAFTVQGNTVVSNYEIMPDGRMLVQFKNLKLDKKTQTGQGTQDSPFVDNIVLGGYQSGFLEKVK